MRRFKRLLVVLLLAVSAMTAAAMIPSFGDLQAAPVEMASHQCECPDGCPPDGSDCPDAQLCSVMSGTGIVATAPSAMAPIQGVREVRFAVQVLRRDSLSQPPPFHPPKR